jgi:hypothetical protein
VHWFVTTRSRTYDAFTRGMLNDRMIRSGATGRGKSAGNALAGLVNTSLNSESCVQSTSCLASHTRIWNCRSAENRLWAGSVWLV